MPGGLAVAFVFVVELLRHGLAVSSVAAAVTPVAASRWLQFGLLKELCGIPRVSAIWLRLTCVNVRDWASLICAGFREFLRLAFNSFVSHSERFRNWASIDLCGIPRGCAMRLRLIRVESHKRPPSGFD